MEGGVGRDAGMEGGTGYAQVGAEDSATREEFGPIHWYLEWRPPPR